MTSEYKEAEPTGQANADKAAVRLPHYSGPVKLGVCLSGGGTTLANLIRSIDSGDLDAEIVHVVATSKSCGGVGRATTAGLNVSVVERADFDSDDAFSDAIYAAIGQPDLIILAGFLKRLVVKDSWQNRVLNIHPSLIPAFCGQGFYGKHVHRAAIDRGVKTTGCTVHFVDNEYDHGPIVAQRCVPVLSDDTVKTLAARVFEQECQLYPEAIQLVASGRLQVAGRRVLEDAEYVR